MLGITSVVGKVFKSLVISPISFYLSVSVGLIFSFLKSDNPMSFPSFFLIDSSFGSGNLLGEVCACCF